MSSHPKTFLQEALEKTRTAFIYSAIFSFFINLLMIALPLYSMQVFDRVISSASVETLLMLSLATAFTFFIMGLLTGVRSFVLSRVGEWLDITVAPRLLEASVTRAAAQNLTSGGGQNLRDLANVKNFITGAGINTLFDAPWAAIFLVIIYIIHPVIGLASLFGGIALFVLATMTEISTRKPLNDASKHAIKASNTAESATRNAEVIEAMGMMRHVIAHWQTNNHESVAESSVAANRSNLIMAASKIIRMFLQIMVIGLGAYYALLHEITSGGMLACSILTGRALAPFEAAIGIWKSFISARDSYRRLNLNITNSEDVRGRMPLPAPLGELKLEGVIFRPARVDKPIIKGVTFTLLPGESLGLIGPSAAGKSTLIKLIVGIWPATVGSIRLDSAEVFKWNREDFGRYVGYMPQDVELFSGSVADNIARLQPNPQPEAVIEAAKWAGVHEMILRLPKGYETEIGDSGMLLSPGQRQRIGLARALFGGPRMLVLDEPNSNLDSEGEAGLQVAIRMAKERNITTLIVAHRPSIISGVDKIAMMRDGALEAFGPRDQVLAKYTKAVPAGGTARPAAQGGVA